ncbi:DUF934 domain-containing protein [Halocynthiibacter namhaensis]|uniref:DUF934 domain-containing protein n=1 Tax=Halocynthiibacter namhaensis TaxID=1290553 RepID=UPI0005794A13|nr:DUF934 domain-containing protein [Halocynthiibacter namhaensis]
MTVIINDTGFAGDDWEHGFFTLDELPANHPPALAVDLPSDMSVDDLPKLLHDVDLVRIDFPSFADGRGFTLARRLRDLGFVGRLRARGHVISDQYAMARRSGFDEVEIDDDLAARQPEGEWIARANWQDNNYQSRLRG